MIEITRTAFKPGSGTVTHCDLSWKVSGMMLDLFVHISNNRGKIPPADGAHAMCSAPFQKPAFFLVDLMRQEAFRLFQQLQPCNVPASG
jgi:hypothetical protein